MLKGTPYIDSRLLAKDLFALACAVTPGALTPSPLFLLPGGVAKGERQLGARERERTACEAAKAGLPSPGSPGSAGFLNLAGLSRLASRWRRCRDGDSRAWMLTSDSPASLLALLGGTGIRDPLGAEEISRVAVAMLVEEEALALETLERIAPMGVIKTKKYFSQQWT